MLCRACGRIIANENANFCEYCGTATNVSRDGSMDYNSAEGVGSTPYRETYQQGKGYGRNAAGDPGLAGILNGTAGLAEEEENSMSFLHWIVIMLLPLLPMIGMFAYLAVLLIWAFGRTASKTRKNWARATLVILAVSLLMVMYMFQTLLGSGGMTELMNSMLGAGGGM